MFTGSTDAPIQRLAVTVTGEDEVTDYIAGNRASLGRVHGQAGVESHFADARTGDWPLP